jgi:hypothetical protein
MMRMNKALIVALGLLLITLFALYAAGMFPAAAVGGGAERYCVLVGGFPVDACMRIVER